MKTEKARRAAVQEALGKATHTGELSTYGMRKLRTHHNASFRFQEERQQRAVGAIGFVYSWLWETIQARRAQANLVTLLLLYDKASGKARKRHRRVNRARFNAWRRNGCPQRSLR